MYKSNPSYRSIPIVLSFLISIITPSLFSQPILEQYVRQGIENNIVVENKNISLDQSKWALEQAKTYFLPSFDLSTRYTLAAGGRTIDLPVGDLLNGVYSTLNELTGSSSFPTLQNVREQLNPNNFLDAKVQVSYPLLDPSLKIQRDIRSRAVKLSEKELDIYKIELTRDIKVAYYNYSSAYISLRVYEDAEKLLAQNVKDNTSLLKNGKGLPANVIRAESEQAALQAEKIKAENQLKHARLYLNFLLNQPPETEILYQPVPPKAKMTSEDILSKDLSNNTELQRMENVIEIQKSNIELSKSYSIPRIHTFADLGVQTFNFRFEDQSPYIMAGIQVTLPIYHNGRNKMKVQQEVLSLKSLENQKELLTKNLHRKVQTAYLELESAYSTVDAADKRVYSSEKYFELIDKSYREGVTSQIEYLDARQQLTEATLQYHIAVYNVLKTKAELEKLLTSF